MQILDLCVIIFTVSFIGNSVFAGGFAADGIDRLPTDKKSFLFFSILFLLNTAVSGVTVFALEKYVFADVPIMRIILSPTVSVIFMSLLIYAASRYTKAVYLTVKPYVQELIFNTATVGTVYSVTPHANDIKSVLVYVTLSVFGVLFSYVIFTDVTERIIEKHMPRAFRGLSGILITLGLIMMVFSCITGIRLPVNY